ncbi:hypothetical protein Mkiyose1665_06450 [Mycobacterium kiyosense]|uniref:HNH nuclease domain-containing protein n=1 Tax=Mycobacterium kiyosense TaxID=2871094 RepID=A0A9P3UVM1_9MYCO|nr:hypothetical protein IWGMT90018_29910 [Mycobacterium kiyosense]BDE14194.1 hypothetical protein MKCMC460_30540 [Mycobacterium sp. 20KCMC460]GLB81590.1 hypothetical protein SRL2020028_08460 [Mycobacterium kiyosense]GLB89132.1 hypothetical protein SRL2020130_19490 [Mycobacterium kiyosense]GLB93783.1 hypothetical protein SRL2020226_05590 [Mycobacterium kiyosense]
MLGDPGSQLQESFEVFYERSAQRPVTPESAAFLQRIRDVTRLENQAAAAQLTAIGELFAYRLGQCTGNELWAIDTMEAVAAEVAAALRIGQTRAVGKVRYARAMRERLPQTAQVFSAGDIDAAAFGIIVFRTDAIEDPEVLARVDALIAANVTRWPSLSKYRLAAQVDKIVVGADVDALRRRQQRHRGREILISEDGDGIALIEGSLATPDALALDQRLTAMAATVCPNDPRTRDERRADALGALAAGADRLGCRCGRPDCAAGQRKPAAPVVIHVIAEQATLDGTGATPASVIGAEGLITPELLAELAVTARQLPLVHPGFRAPEPGYRPSKELADFVRARDLTCRWPGCDVPATRCDIDHSIPHADGGPTHAANLHCKCRTHHLVKTFWGWREQQLADGTIIFTSPGGDTHVTTPGSALLFPGLCTATGGMPSPEATTPPVDYCGERTAMMPTRRRTRAQDRAQRIATERAHNRQIRESRYTDCCSADVPRGAEPEEPPPF